jgi:hypothetical protein
MAFLWIGPWAGLSDEKRIVIAILTALYWYSAIKLSRSALNPPRYGRFENHPVNSSHSYYFSI